MMKRSLYLKSSVALGALLALGVTAAAQETVGETVVVTGTRIQRSAYELPNPVQMVDSQAMANIGTTNVTDYLSRLPALVGSMSNYNTTGYGTPASDDGSSMAGLNLLNLRNLGVSRTLVLVDGKRHVSEATGSAAVDTNTIPLSLIDRVEVATGGASAIYGADGVSGVVNFIMKRDLEGLHAKVQGGFSQDGGGSTLLTSLAYGYNTPDGRGNISAAIEFSEQGRLNYMERDFTRPGALVGFVPNPDGKSPQRVPTKDRTYVWSAVNGVIATDVNARFHPDFTGDGKAFVSGREYTDYDAVGGSGMPAANVVQGDFLPVQSRKLAQADAHYDFSDWFKVSGEFKFAKVTSDSRSTPPWDDFVVINSDNAFLPQNIKDAINAGSTGFGVFGADYLGLRRRERVTRDTYRASLDVTGDLSPLAGGIIDNLTYDLSYVWGKTDVNDTKIGVRVEDRFFAAMDSVADPVSGKPTCRSNVTPGALPPDTLALFGWGSGYSDTSKATYGKLTFTPGANSGCVAYNPFTPFADQSAALGFMTRDLYTLGHISQQVVSGTLAGNFKQAEALFAGPLSVVVGGEYRIEKSATIGDPAGRTGETFDRTPNDSHGSFDVGEAFAEVSLPVIKNQPLIEEFSVDGAVRYSSYSSAGSTTTWKFGGVWQMFDWLRLRGTNAYAVRAPNIGEMFAPSQTVYSNVNDPCDKQFINTGTSNRVANCTAIMSALGVPYTAGVTPLATAGNIMTYVMGNQNLKPESARTLTMGFVVQPVKNLTLSADWYRVVITNAISAPAAQDIVNKCVDLSSITNPFCGQITRDPKAQVKGQLSLINVQQINVASYETAGVDFDAAYHFDPRDFGVETDYGMFDLHLMGNYLNSLYLTPLLGEPAEYQVAEKGAPKWQMTFDLTWTYGDFDINYNVDWYSPTLRASHIVMNAAPDRFAPEYIKYPAKDVSNLQLGYRFAPEYRAYFGVNNLFYQKPGVGSSDYPVDPLGRFFYFGLTVDTKGGLPKLPF